MPNSTIKLQDIIDLVYTLGDLTPVLPLGGFATVPALNTANEVMSEMLAARFNWKFNRLVLPPFITNSWQQDYATISEKRIGWLEHGVGVDINNTMNPKPIWPIEVKRDLERSSFSYGRPLQACWLPNDQLVQATWPGAGQTYTNPVGVIATPSNPPMNIVDAHGNILVLTSFGVTGGVAPVLPASSAAGATVNDGSCVWTVADPKAQGIRIAPLPPQAGIACQVYLIAQARPLRFISLQQTLEPVPDDYGKWFQDGFIAYCHRNNANPAVKARFPEMYQLWMKGMKEAARQGDRESDSAGIVPDRGIMESSYATPIGPAWPFGTIG